MVVSAVAAAVVFVATGGNPAAAAATFSFTNTFLSAQAQGVSIGRSLAAATVSAAVSYVGVSAGLGAGSTLAGAAIGASFGAAGGAATSAILGGSPGRGALSGAVGGAIIGGTAGAVGAAGLEGWAAFGAMVAGSAAAGAASAAVANRDPGEGAYLGAIGAVSFAVASASFQKLVDVLRARGGETAVAEAGYVASNKISPDRSLDNKALRQIQSRNALEVSKAQQILNRQRGEQLVARGKDIAEFGGLVGLYGTATSNPWLIAAGTTIALVGGIVAGIGAIRATRANIHIKDINLEAALQ